MFNSVQYVRDLCQQMKIPISKLEKDCGFSNGYLNPKKMTKLPYDRAILIAERLNVPVSEILEGPKKEKTPTVPRERTVDLSEVDFAFYGDYKELSEAEQETLRDMVRIMRQRRAAKENNK